ncbi:rho guanine nucleotide exchange factor 12 isoform X3 [Hemibagrus wyckioides]|uniref:rho guanine nucleotide exchange factor 12 isoform X3 n=1 Tax=Hemibagrus wyckioides TaxID=337641 RepID=UPI00266CC8EC|nr:rho guanine nucleotide exchange factor 12 isoform X3 [Hemibagrus wyckioides]
MSDTQPTLSDRFSKKAIRTNSILSRDHPPDKKPKSDKSSALPAQDFDSTGLVQRCVIIQKDENGFGLTVSGDNPVFVQLVKEDGAAMRAGVQTGDRIIKVNGTLVTQSNHVEVVKLIKSGSYVALTVLGRPPGLPQIPLSEVDLNLESLDDNGTSTVSFPRSPPQIRSKREYKEENSIMHSLKVDLEKKLAKDRQDFQEEYGKNPTLRLLRDIQEAQKTMHRVTQDGLPFGDGEGGRVADVDEVSTDSVWGPVGVSQALPRRHSASPKTVGQKDWKSPKSSQRNSFNSCSSPEIADTSDLDSHLHPGVKSAPSRLASQIIGAEDDYFDSEHEQEQVNVQCNCFQSLELLKSRPAHLAAFLHHVVSQFDPASVLCYLYTELYKQTNSKETRRIFMDIYTFFIDKGANLKVTVPESISSELERRRPELIPEELHRQYVHTMQDTLLPEVNKLLEDFRQKHSMGLTLAEVELAHLDTEQVKDATALERERSCAENILTKIDDILLSTLAAEEEKCTTIQYVIYFYMKHLGVRVKEQRNLESKRVRINFLPKIKSGYLQKSSKLEKEGEEKMKKPRFNILGPQRRPSRIETTPAVGRNVDGSKPRPQKQLSQPAMGKCEVVDGGRLRGSLSSEGSDLIHSPTVISNISPYSPISEPAFRDTDCSMNPSSTLQRLSDGMQVGEGPDMTYPPCDYSPYNVEHLDEDREGDRLMIKGFCYDVRFWSASQDENHTGFVDVGTPKLSRRLEETLSEDDGVYSDMDLPNWQQLVKMEVLAELTPQEIKRQEVINELFYTERAHVRMLKVLDNVFYQKLTRDNILPPADIKNIFSNLEEIIQLHVMISEQMAAIRKRNETSVVDQIGDDLLSWFSREEEERMKNAVGTFCSNQPFALELIKSRQKKDQRFQNFMHEAESNRMCRRLQLKDIIPAEMQRLTKYPLLLENIAKYTGDPEEKDKVRKAADCCRKILNHVNQAVKESENKQHLEDYQRRLDLSSLKQSENPLVSDFKNLDLTKRKLIHEGPLTWKLNKDKTVELYTLLLEDILVLLQKQDERLVLKCHSKNRAGSADTQHIFSPVIMLNTVLVRSVATDNRSFFVLSMSDNGAQIYELMAQTVSEQRIWQRHIIQRAEAMKSRPHGVIPLPQSSVERNGVGVGKLAKAPERECVSNAQASGKACDAVSDHTSRNEEQEQTQAHGQDESCYPEAELLDGCDTDAPSSSSRADEALKTLAALKQVLVTQLMAQNDDERMGRRLLRTTSLRTSCRTQDASSGDTGFYDGTEDYGYLVLEGSGGSESSTDDGVQYRRKELGLSRGCAADSGISLRFSSSSAESLCGISRQVLTYLRALQTNLNHLKEVESRYYLLKQKQESADAGGNKEGRITAGPRGIVNTCL